MDHFTGLHFQVCLYKLCNYSQPWNRMGNIKGWANPISLTFLKNEILLNKQVLYLFSIEEQIVEREVALGMLPVLPAFSGYVPDELIEKYPNVSYSISQAWNGFRHPIGQVRLLEPVDPLFKQIGSMFIQEQLYPFILLYE